MNPTLILILKILLQVLAVGSACLINLIDYFWHDKRRRRFKHARKFLIPAAILLLIISITITINDDIESRHLQEVTLGNLTGGDSYCFILVSHIEGDLFVLSIVNEGTYPIFDTYVSVVDMNNLKQDIEGKNGLAIFEVMAQHTQSFEVGTVVPTLVKSLGGINLEGTTQKLYRVNINSRYRYFAEDMKLVKINGRWLTAIRVFEESPTVKPGEERHRKLLKEAVPPEFPRDENGQVIWD